MISSEKLLSQLWLTPEVAGLVTVFSPHPLFLVGGAVRDALLGLAVKDLDFVVDLSAEAILDFKEKLSRSMGAGVGVLDAKRGILRCYRKNDSWFDLAARQGASIVEDLKRRDFTLNAMAIDPTGRLWDPLDGASALAERKLQATSATALKEDPLRVVRAFRLAASLKLVIENDTKCFMRDSVLGLERVAGERIKEELLRFFSGLTRPLLNFFREVGVARAVLGLEEYEVPWAWLHEYVKARGAPYDPLAILACLTLNRPEVLQRLKPSGEEVNYVRRWQEGCKLLQQQKPATSRDILELIERAGSALAVLLEFAKLQAFINPLGSELGQRILDEQEGKGELCFTPCPLRGGDLCARFKAAPGPWVGEMLKELRAAWVCKEVTSEGKLWDYAKQLWEEKES